MVTRVCLVSVVLVLVLAGLMHAQPCTAQSAPVFPLYPVSILGDSVTNTGPSLVSFNSMFYYALTGVNNIVYVATSTDGRTWSTLTPITSLPPTQASPSFAIFNNKLYIGLTRLDTSIQLASSEDGTTWSRSTLVTVPGNTPSDKPVSLAVFNNQLYIGYASTDNFALVISTPDGVSFPSQPIRLLKWQNAWLAPPSLAVFSNQLFYAVTTMHSGIQQTWMGSSSDGSAWSIYRPFHLDSQHMTPLVTFNDQLYLFSANTDGNIYLTQAAPSPPSKPTIILRMAVTNYAPAVAVFNNFLYLAITGQDGHAYIAKSR